GWNQLHHCRAITLDRLVPARTVAQLDQQTRIATNQAPAVCLGHRAPQPATCYQRLVAALPGRHVPGVVLIVTLDDPGCSLPAGIDEFVDSTMRQAAAAV